MTSAGVHVSIWRAIGAATVQGHRESRDESYCMTALGWKPMSNTWDGTLAALNEDIAVNRSVVAAVRQPSLGDGVIALIDMSESGFADSDIVLHTTETPLYAPSQINRCIYTVTPRWWSRYTEVSCNNAYATETKVA